VSDQNRFVEFEGIDYGENILAQPLTYVLRVRIAGSTESASRNAINAIVGRELRREVVKHMRSVSASGQQHHCSS